MASKKCPKCNKTVYQAEWIEGLGDKWHRPCWKCEKCKKQFAPNTQDIVKHTESGLQLYCKKCNEVTFGKATETEKNAPRVVSSTESSFVREGAFSRPEFANNRVPAGVQAPPRAGFSAPAPAPPPKPAPAPAPAPAPKPVAAPVPTPAPAPAPAPVVEEPTPEPPSVPDVPIEVPSGTITIAIHDTASEQEMPLDISPTASIAQVKTLVSEATGVPADQIALGFNEQELTDDQSLDGLGIVNGSVVLAIFPEA